jgi:hypothetical protein
MQVRVLFDGSGNVIAMLYPTSEATNMPNGSFEPSRGQFTATLDVPPEVRHLGSRELHNAVRVDLSEEAPRLRAKTSFVLKSS